MKDRSTKRESGFSLLEMVVATALGSIVLAAAVQMYIQGVTATWKVSQRAELQQDFRAASNVMVRDLSLAGAGLGQGAAIALPTTATSPVYGCDQSGTCYINGSSVAYPKQGSTPYLYGLIPGYAKGPTINSQSTDIVTVVYTDTSFYLNCYTPTVTALGVVTFAPAGPVAGVTPPFPPAGCYPSGGSLQAVNDANVGLTPGDLVMMTLNGVRMVAEVTGAITTGTNANGQTTYSVPFANNDKLKMNQTPGGGGLNSAAVGATGSSSSAPCPATGPCRIFVITYYLDASTTPARLMQQVSGHTPMPVAENMVYMKFTYDLYNDATNTPAVGCQNPGVSGDVCVSGSSTGLLPNQVTKINIQHLAMDSTLKGAQFGLGNGYQGLDLPTSVSARNLTYSNNYPQN
jgi:prepilin-type N-terminal cleavage/methylation domain-containing protein